MKKAGVSVGIYAIIYGVSYFLSRTGRHYMSGILLILLALVIYGISLLKTKNLVNLRGILGLSWIGGQGLACFQLSKLQSDWDVMTWICFGIIYIVFCLGYEIFDRRERAELKEKIWGKNDRQAGRILVCIVGLAVVSAVCFALEAVFVGFIPFFSELPHAYSYFHISGVHYFTISCILIPALTVVYSKVSAKISRPAAAVLLVCNVMAVAIPILCVSRFQLLFAVGFAVVVYLLMYKKIPLKAVIVMAVLMVPAYVILTKARNHDVAYLNSIFEMKNGNTPIFVTQPYMYIVNNYENFNCMVEQIVRHTMGLKMLFPVFALTGIKFVFPQLVSFPAYITKPELTTLTMFYDAYYDFGLAGIILFSAVLGVAAYMVVKLVQKSKNPLAVMFYGQIAIYFGLSFFTTWFSNPTTWFWLALTTVMYLFVGYRGKEKKQ